MSDSEDEIAFASADEGDSPTKSSTATGGLKDEGQKYDKKDVKKGANAKKSGGGISGKARSQESVTPEVSVKKEPENQQKQSQSQSRQKKKGGKGNIQNPQIKAKITTANINPSSSTEDTTDNVLKDQPTKAEVNKGNKVENQSDKSPSAKNDPETDSKSIPTKIPQLKEETAEDVSKSKDTKNSEDHNEAKGPSPAAIPEKSGQGGGGGWGWGGWGSSLLSAASTSVQTFTHQIGDGISTIMDTVESSLDDLVTDDKDKPKKASEADSALANEIKEDDGRITEGTSKENVKDADQLCDNFDEAKVKTKSEKSESTESNPSGGNFFASWGIADIAKKVTDTGKTLASKGQTLMTDGFDAVENLASGGIDVLESIGKKTYHTFSEHDPAFKKTREYLKSRGTKPNLSSILREAKEKAENEAVQAKENEEARKVHFETQLDEYQGIAHLEALEMLSGQSEKKVLSLLNSLSSEDHKVIKPILISIKEVFEIDEEESNDPDDKTDQDFSCLVNKHLSELKLGTSSDKLNKVHEMVKQWMADLEMQNSIDPKAIHQQAIQSLAELTSKGVEQFHKAGELVLMQRDSEKDCKERAHSFARLTGVLCHEIGNLATKFTDCLNKSVTAEKEETDVRALVTNIYLEASNSTTYIQDAFQLLLPILQQAAIEHMILARQS